MTQRKAPLTYLIGRRNGMYFVKKQRAPLHTDTGQKLGCVWLDIPAKNAYLMTANANGYATWDVINPSSGFDWQESVLSATTAEAAATETEGYRYLSAAAGATWLDKYIYQWQSGTWEGVAPSTGMAVYIEDTALIEIYDGTNWVSITAGIPNMTATTTGLGELATDAESIAGTLTDYRVINPSSLKAKLGTQTDHGVLVGSGTTAALTALAVGTNGQVLLGSTGADPVFATIGSTDSSVTVTAGAGTLALTVTQAAEAQLGGAEVATDAETLTGTSDALMITPDKLNHKLGTQTLHGVIVGAATTAALTALAVGTNGQVLLGSTGADPVFGTIGSSDSTIAWTLGAGTLTAQARPATEAVTGVVEFATAAETTTGTSDALATHPAGVNTKLGTQTQYAVMLGGGGAGSNLGITTAGTNGQVIVGSTGAAPDFATIGSTDSSVTVTAGAGTLALTVTQAAEAQLGGAEVATDAETLTGTSDALMITPDKLNHKLGTQTLHGVLVGGATTAALTALAVGTNGQVLLGSTGADPVFATIGSSDSTIAWTVGAGTLTAQARAGTEAQTGVVELATAAETTTGTSDALATHPAGVNTKCGTQTDHGVVLGGGGAGFNLGVTAVGTNGQVLVGSTGADPVFATIGGLTGLTATTGAGTLSLEVEESYVRTADVTISAAEIVLLMSAPITLVAAPAAGKAIQFLGAIASMDYDTAAYNAPTNAGDDLAIIYDGAAQCSETLEATGFINAAGDLSKQVVPAIADTTVSPATALKLDNIGIAEYGNPGTAAGVIHMRVLYRIVTTGLA